MDWQPTQKQWHDLAARATYMPLHQDWAYGQVMAECGADVHRIMFREEGQAIGLVQIIERPFLFGLMRIDMLWAGPVWCDGVSDDVKQEAYAQLAQLFPKYKCRFLVWIPPLGLAEDLIPASKKPILSGHSEQIVDISCDADMRRQNMHPKWQSALRKCQREGGEIQITQAAKDIDWILTHCAQLQGVRGYRHYSREINEKILEHFDFIALIAKKSGQRIAGSIFLIHGRSATYHISYTSQMGRNLCAAHGIIWDAIEHLKKQGIMNLNMGVIDTHTTPGIARFKLGLGGRVVQSAGSYL